MSELHYLFSDESGYVGESRHGSIAVIAGSRTTTKKMNDIIKESLGGKSEIKFSGISSRKDQEIAKHIINKSLELTKINKLKINVIIWDKHDSRHSIANRCDLSNLIIMYYRVLRHSLKHWSEGIDWAFYPDQQTSVKWSDLINILSKKPISDTDISSQIMFDFFNKSIYPNIRITRELDSKEFPIVQLADLFAGIARTSREDSLLYQQWIQQEDLKLSPSLFPVQEAENLVSKSKKTKFEIVRHFHDQTKRYNLGINYSENKYLKSHNPNSNLNFWHYTPQGAYDKAPTKQTHKDNGI